MNNKMKFCVSVLIGFVAGGLFAEGERPFSIGNTIHVGYTDNLYYRGSGNEEDSVFVTDSIDFAYRAAFSSRTDLILKSQINFMTDKDNSSLYPNLMAILSHAVSPRLNLGLRNDFFSGDRSGSWQASGKNERYWYYLNTAGVSADYLFTEKDRLKTSGDYTILRNEDDDILFMNDYNTVSGGLSWNHEISPQRTYTTMNLKQRLTEYENRVASFDATDLSVGFGHTFNPEWQCTLDAGGTYVSPDVAGAIDQKSTLHPMVDAGIVYSPSPITRFSANAQYRYDESSDSRYGGQNSRVFALGVQHSLTAKLMAQATTRFTTTDYDQYASTTGASITDDRWDVNLRLTYKLNRMHSLEAGAMHSETDRGGLGEDWKQNRVDVGWRIDLK